MSGFSSYTTNKLLNHIFSGTTYSTPEKYLALLTSSSGLSSNANWSGNELSSSAVGYARLPLEDSVWTESTTGSVTTNADMMYTVAGSHWGEVSHVAIVDAPSGGNVIAWGALANPVTGVEETRNVETGDQLVVRAGSLSISIV